METGLSINSNENSEDIIIEDLNILKKNKKGFNVDKEKEKEIEKILTTPSNSVKVDLKKKYILNKNILDKFSRVIERKFFNVNILIAKIFDNLLEPENFDILSNDYNLLVNFSNEVLNLLETIKSTLVAPRLNLRCYSFLQYLIKSKNLSEDQSESINEIITNFPLRNSSETFKNVNNIFIIFFVIYFYFSILVQRYQRKDLKTRKGRKYRQQIGGVKSFDGKFRNNSRII